MSAEISRSTQIAASPGEVWRVISDIENAGAMITGIKSIEVLEVASGPSIVGLKWRETREFMGRDAVEVMWVTDARDASWYETRAESHGAIYTSRMAVEASGAGARLTMKFSGQPVTFGAHVMWLLTGWMAMKSLKKVIDQDLEDIKRAVESQT